MNTSANHPINFNLWTRMLNVSPSEQWKYASSLWDPLIDKIYSGEVRAEELVCPVCGYKQVYAYFLGFRLAQRATVKEGRPVVFGDRFFGCRNCETQIRDYGLVPPWVRPQDIPWASQKAKEEAEEELHALGIGILQDETLEETDSSNNKTANME